MLPRKPRHTLYALLLIALSIVCTSAIANTKVYSFISDVVSVLEKPTPERGDSMIGTPALKTSDSYNFKNANSEELVAPPMFMTIIQGADEEVGCSTNGLTVARFNLCGDSDDRIISLSGSPGSVSWQILNGGCSPDINEDCPNTNTGCYTQVGTGATFNLTASSIPATTGAEFRVVADGTSYYFKVKKSTITQTTVENDFICGVPGRIQVTNLSSAYEFSIDNGSGFGPWQGPIFDGLTPGTYIVKARLRNTPNTCEYPYQPIVINQIDMDIDVTFTDALCAGDTGTITVTPTVGIGPYKYTLLNSSGVPQEFTAFIPDNPYTFSAVGFGTYTVQVETQQCTGDPLNGIDPPRQSLDTGGNPIVIGNGLVPLDASTEVNESFNTNPSCSPADIPIIVRTTGGSPPYTFTVNGSAPVPTPVPYPYNSQTEFRVSTAGTYDFVITDSNGCTINASANVAELDPPDITATGVDGDCTNGGNRININVIDANGYNLSFRADPADPWDTNPVLPVPDGTYSPQVRYQQGTFDCILDIDSDDDGTPDSITVTGVGPIVGSATKISDRTCDGSGGTNGGQIDFVGPFSGGSGSGYIFSIDGSNFSATLSYPDLIPGTYTPIIVDGGSCRLELPPITILDVDPPTDLDFVQSNSNCTTSTSDVQLVPTSNAPIVNYSIISPITLDNGASDTFIGLSTTTSYIFQITDANNCIYQEGFSPALISSIRARVKSGGDLRVCNGATDGSGTFLIDGFSNNYTYDINGGLFTGGPQNDGEVVLPPSGAGTYTITVTDVDTGCTDTASFDIQESSLLTLTGTITPMSCANNNLGRVVANPSGGWGSNRYTLIYPGGATTIGPKSGPTFGNLSQGTDALDPLDVYTLIVEDSEGCTATFEFDLTPIDAPTLALDPAASDFCYVPGPGATVAVTSTAGSAPGASHQYRINGGPLQASPVFTGIAPGNYTVEVIDGNNCSDTVSMTINPQLRVNASIETEIPCGGAPGQIRVVVTGGYTSGAGPKQYEVSSDNGVSFGAPIPLASNNFLYDTTTPGTYIFRVSDNNTSNSACTASSVPVILDPPVSIDPPTVNVTPASCGQNNNGIVTIIPDATSGIPPYEISFDGGPFGSQTTFSNLIAGNTYPYVVRDARGCETLPASVLIPLDGTPPPDASVSPTLATCSLGTVEGSIQVTGVAGGTPDFTYILQDQFGVELFIIGPTSSTSETFSNLAPGIYTVVTIDALGCRDTDTVTVVQTSLDVVPDPVVPVCDVSGFSNTVEIIGGVGPNFLIRLENDPNPPVTPNSPPRRHTFSGLQYGVTYTVEVTDLGTNCVYLVEIPPVEGPTPLDVTANSTPGFCDVNRNGEIIYTVTGFTVGDDLRIELLNNGDGTRIDLHNPVTTVADPFVDNTLQLPGDYQIIVTNLTDNCTDATGIIIDQNLPSIDILNLTPANCNADGAITVQGSGGAGGPYTFAFMPVTVTPTPGDFGTATTFTGPAGNYDVYVMDSSGCTSFAIAEIIPLSPALPTPTFIVENQCDVTSTSFDIVVQVPSTVDTPRFTLGGDTQFGVLNGGGTLYEYTFNVSTPGDYIVDVVDADGCTSQGTATVYEFLSASGGFSTLSTCNAADGVITISTIGGSGDFDYDLTGTDYLGGGVNISQTNNPVFTNMLPGSYQVTVTDNIVFDGSIFCFFTVNNINLDEAIVPAIGTVLENDISCNGADDGSIDITLVPGTDFDGPIEYTLYNAGTTTPIIQQNGAGSFTGLTPGNYDVVVRSDRNCTVTAPNIQIDEPPVFSITASAPDFACEPGANRFSSTTITTTVVDPGTVGSGYQYSITGHSNYQTSPTFEIVDNGSVQNITVYAIDGNGCRHEFTLPPINPPTEVVPSIIYIDPLNCRDFELVRIQVIGTSDFTVSAISAVAAGPWTNAPGIGYVDVLLPAAGDYLFEVQDNVGGCAYPMPVHTVNEPIQPTAVIAEAKPVSCFGASDGELSIEVTDYTGEYDYNVYSASDPGKTTILAMGTLDTADNPEIIAGLPGGNFFVDIVSEDEPFCRTDSNSATIRTPSGPLGVSTVPVGNVGCNNNSGKIEATGEFGWNVLPYEYRLLRSSDGGLTYTTELVPFSNNNEFENLPFGFYQVEIRDSEGCTATDNIQLEEVLQIDAGIREPQALVCPNGNNAVLEAYDPSTGDASTAIAGATGGVAGAGYNYRLLYLNSNDNTDIISTSGLQSSPTFIGASGGFISGGWYAIEVSSSYDCIFVTPPYFVNPPPPVEPRLVQTRVPGCGGQGEVELRIENPDPLFTYEFQPVENGVVVGPYQDMTGTSQRFPGDAGITYQFDVRKKNAANTCLAVRSNGITMTDAFGITLSINTPDDISCASELDGRIESFVSGGVGNNRFFLYEGDPVDAFNPDPGARFIREANDGTFEGLDAGDNYYIAVTSGLTCSDILRADPIVRPEPILFTADSTPVTCNGEEDGTVTIEVTSGGVGLIQFAIEPNFNEFFSDPATPGVYTFDELAVGDYEILIQDENGCFEKDVISVMEPPTLQISNLQTTPELCIGANDGTVVFNIVGGTPFDDPLISPTPYFEYKIEMIDPINETGTGVFAPYDGGIIQNLQGGASYALYIQDANGCDTSDVFTIGIGVDLTAEPIVQYGCEGIFPNSTATVEMQDSSLLPRLLFALDVDDITQADATRTWGDLPPGDHTVYIYHENGCTNFVEFSIDAYDPLTLTAVKTGPDEITATAEGGFGGYEFFFDGESYGTENIYRTNVSGTVEVRVVDQNGCVAVVPIPFLFTGMLEIPNFFTPDGDNNNDLWVINGREFFPNIEVKIYDRYGRVVAILDQVKNWDGTYEGSELPTGDYWYVVNQNDARSTRYVGHFTLYR
ncbi:T9SS type B sorting domain-containing protein [Ulvibacterium marinum]|uniref:T9SS type B sorting domain-containing protein n=1 Tax=Ulvibacterium marinum TaxID=2419782 RepID=UPI002494BA87|nr:T9SS type B sorting domain-containing protein [Ulvibacterium marinum]